MPAMLYGPQPYDIGETPNRDPNRDLKFYMGLTQPIAIPYAEERAALDLFTDRVEAYVREFDQAMGTALFHFRVKVFNAL